MVTSLWFIVITPIIFWSQQAKERGSAVSSVLVIEDSSKWSESYCTTYTLLCTLNSFLGVELNGNNATRWYIFVGFICG